MKESLSLEEILDWYIEAGVEEIAGNSPFVEFKEDTSKKLDAVSAIKGQVGVMSHIAQATNYALESAKDICSKASSLEELKTKIEEFEGCPLKATSSNTVFGSGNPNAKIMFVGEAPGADEDRIGKPFVGKSGLLLDKMISAIGLQRDDCFVTNILPWRPPGNRTPLDSELAICLPFLKKQIDLVKPEIICMLGGSCANALLEINEPISKIRGKWFEYIKDNSEKSNVIATFHPAYLLKNPNQKAKAWSDMLSLMKKL